MSGVRCFRSWCQSAWVRSGCLRQYTFQFFSLCFVSLDAFTSSPFFFLWSSSYSCMFLLPLELMRIGVASFGVLSSSVLVFFWAFLADTDWRQQLWQFRKSIGFLVDSLVVLSWVSLVSCRYLLLGFDVVYVICFCMFLDWFQLGFSSFQLCFHPF